MKLFKTATLFAIALTALLSVSSVATAAIITVPSGLSLGDQYHLAFVTSSGRDGTSSIIGDYNTFVSNAANDVPELAALGTQWFAIASTRDPNGNPLVSAKVNTGTAASPGLPIFLLNDTQLVDDYDDLWDLSIDVPLNRTELDTAINVEVFTGTTEFGNIDGLALGSTTNVTYGLSSSASSTWIRRNNRPATAERKFYAISGVLTVVPEPSTLAALAVFGVLACHRRRRA